MFWDDRKIVVVAYPLLFIGSAIAMISAYKNTQDYSSIKPSESVKYNIELLTASSWVFGLAVMCLLFSAVCLLRFYRNNMQIVEYINQTCLLFVTVFVSLGISGGIGFYGLATKKPEGGAEKVATWGIHTSALLLAIGVAISFIYIIQVCVHIQTTRDYGIGEMIAKINKGGTGDDSVTSKEYKLVYKAHDGKDYGRNASGEISVVLVPRKIAVIQEERYDSFYKAELAKQRERKVKEKVAKEYKERMALKCFPAKNSGNEAEIKENLVQKKKAFPNSWGKVDIDNEAAVEKATQEIVYGDECIAYRSNPLLGMSQAENLIQGRAGLRQT